MSRDAQIDGEFTRYRLSKKGEADQKRCKRIIGRNGGSLDELGIFYPPKTCEDELYVFQHAIRKKANKIQSYRTHGFTRIGLFVLYKEIPIPQSIDMFIKQLHSLQNGCDEQYDFLFLCYSCGMIWYDQKTN